MNIGQMLLCAIVFIVVYISVYVGSILLFKEIGTLISSWPLALLCDGIITILFIVFITWIFVITDR